MGKKSHRPLLRGIIPSERDAEDLRSERPGIDENDEVDEFFEDRHQTMLKDIDSDGSQLEGEPEPELVGTEVMRVHSSESEDSGDSDEDDEKMPVPPEEDKKGWGARRKDWYGGDTHEFEIMEDNERDEALRDEEEEALRMQRKALEALKPEDFRDEDDSETEPEKEESEDGKKPIDQAAAIEDIAVAADLMETAAPEVPALVKEMIQSHRAAQVLQTEAKSNETLRVIYHLHASLVNNVAYYLSLRTDPETQGAVDIRSHPVLLRILSIRKLLQKSSEFSICKDDDKNDKMEHEDPAIEIKAFNDAKVSDTKLKSSDGNSLSKKKGEEGVAEDGNHEEMNEVLSKGKKRTRKRRGRKRKRAEVSVEEDDDEEKVHNLLNAEDPEARLDIEDKEKQAKTKKKKLRNIVNVMESQRKNLEGKRSAPPDEDLVHREKMKAQRSVNALQAADESNADVQSEDDDKVMQKMLAKKAKKEARKERKAAAAEPHVYRLNDKTTPDGKRKASSQVVRNKGLTRYRPRNKKTPRTKNRMAYDKAVKRRKGAVREYVGKPGVSYSGEASGINMSARKGSKLSEV